MVVVGHGMQEYWYFCKFNKGKHIFGETYEELQIKLKEYIKKHSFEQISLVEKGDYVNGFEVSRKDGYVVVVLDFFGQTRGIEAKNIKSIVTKEQLESITYKL